MEGSLILLFALGLLLGWAAMCLGLFLSTKAKSEFQAMQLVMPILFPVLLLSGILWPVEALPIILREISMVLPTTWASEAFRSIMMRGWGLSSPVIWQAFLVVFVFGILMLVAATKSLKVRS
jgi:ABC-2 type transport system permease protein